MRSQDVAAALLRLFAGVALTMAVSLSLLLATVPPAAAAVITDRPLLFTFNGEGSTAGTFAGQNFENGFDNGPISIVFDNVDRNIYVASQVKEHGSVSKFTPQGVASNFSATGSSSIFGVENGKSCASATNCAGLFSNELRVAVDNSSGPHRGRLYVSQFGEGKLFAFGPGGEYLWSLVPPIQPLALAVDAEGHPWIAHANISENNVLEYANTEEAGKPPALFRSFSLPGPEAMAFAPNGDCYFSMSGTVESEVLRYSACNFGSAPALVDADARLVYVNQSTSEGQVGHVFTAVESTPEIQLITVDATAGQFRLTFEGETTGDLSYDASEGSVRAALEALPAIGAGDVSVSSRMEGGARIYDVQFLGLLGAANVEQLGCEDGATPLSGGSGCNVSTWRQGAPADFREFDGGDGLLGTFGTQYLQQVTSLAYGPGSDEAYVTGRADPHPVVAVFGPLVTGTVPDTVVDPPSNVRASCAHFAGLVNPQGVGSTWHFEWRQVGYAWVTGGFGPDQSLPVDSEDHPVEYDTCALKGNTTFQVRLVGVNSTNHLRGFSSPVTFTTPIPKPPTVKELEVSNVTTSSARVAVRIDPMEDSTEWRVETQASCAGGWTAAEPSPAPVTFKGTLGPQQAEYDLKGLFPSERYCVRVTAKNGGGAGQSEVKEFETETVPPTDAETAFASWVVDHGALLNARVNPQGAPVTFAFEYSSDGGATWKTSAKTTDAVEARERVLVAESVTGLSPGTTYRYRLALAEDSAGSAKVSGEGAFTTRSEAEVERPVSCPNEEVRIARRTTYLADCRGIELVNSPDTGNQDVRPLAPFSRTPPVSEDGERALWSVFGGAPGSTTGTEAAFLARRTGAGGSSPTGWSSQSIVPAAASQIGGGRYLYQFENATPDLSEFIFMASKNEVFATPPEDVVRLDASGDQEPLRSYPTGEMAQLSDDITDDGAHFLTISSETHQLEDLGGGEPAQLVSVMPNGQPSCGLPYTGESFTSVYGYHMMASTNASRVYFRAPPSMPGEPSKCNEAAPFGLYVRNREANKGQGKTTLIDAGNPTFIRATPDGRSAYFTTNSKLDPKDENNDADIYRWDEKTGKSTCLTCTVNEKGEEVTDAHVVDQTYGLGFSDGVLISEDFSHIYFTSSSQLVPGRGRAGEPMLYVLSGGVIRFVGETEATEGGGRSSMLATARLSHDGNVLVFLGEGTNLTADRLASRCVVFADLGQEGLGGCPEVYRYDDRDGAFECLSCRVGGLTTHGAGGPSHALAATQSGDDLQMSSDGGTVAFATAEALVPRDVNGSADVYVWHNGVLSLVTDGVSRYPNAIGASRVVGVSADGRDVIFATVAPGLTGFERDGLANLYDARVDGGFLPPSPEEICDVLADTCQGPLPAPPFAAPPGSALVFGSGNAGVQSKPAAKPRLRPSRCGKGKVSRRVRNRTRCVKRSHRKNARRKK